MALPVKPTENPTWATDNLFDTAVGDPGSAWHGQANKVVPPPGRVNQGYVPTQAMDAQSINYLLHSDGKWIQWAELALDGVDADIAINAADIAANANDIVDLTSDVTANANNIATNASDIVDLTSDVTDNANNIATNTSDIAANTAVLTNTNINGASGDFQFMDGSRSRTVLISPLQMDSMPGATAVAWTKDTSTMAVKSQANFSVLAFDLNKFLPNGAQLIAIDVIVKPGAMRTGVNRIKLQVFSDTPDFSTPSLDAYAALFTQNDNGTDSVQTISKAGLTNIIIKENKILLAVLTSGNDASPVSDTVSTWRITYLDPGPRNF